MKTLIKATLALVLGITTSSSQAAVVNNEDVLSITSGGYDPAGNSLNLLGSWFAMDLNADSKISVTEKTAIVHAGGIVIGSIQSTPGTIDNWFFYGYTGRDWTNVAVTGSTSAGLNMSGWNVNWNGVNHPMTTGAWNPLNCTAVGVSCSNTNGNGTFTWDGIYGDAYTLDYAATVPPGDASGFGGTKYFLHLVGNVTAAPTLAPVPSAVWLFGSGLLGLLGSTRRKAA